MLNDLFSTLADGLRLAFFLPARRAPIRAAPGRFVLVLVLLWGLVALADYLDTGTAVRLSHWGLAAEAARNYFWLSSILIVLLIDRRPAAFLTVATAVGSAEVPVWITWIAVSQLGLRYLPAVFEAYSPLLSWLVFGWQGIIFLRVMLGPHRQQPLPALMLATVYGGMMYAVLVLVPERSLFVAAHEPGHVRINVEDTYLGR